MVDNPSQIWEANLINKPTVKLTDVITSKHIHNFLQLSQKSECQRSQTMLYWVKVGFKSGKAFEFQIKNNVWKF